MLGNVNVKDLEMLRDNISNQADKASTSEQKAANTLSSESKTLKKSYTELFAIISFPCSERSKVLMIR